MLWLVSPFVALHAPWCPAGIVAPLLHSSFCLIRTGGLNKQPCTHTTHYYHSKHVLSSHVSPSPPCPSLTLLLIIPLPEGGGVLIPHPFLALDSGVGDAFSHACCLPAQLLLLTYPNLPTLSSALALPCLPACHHHLPTCTFDPTHCHTHHTCPHTPRTPTSPMPVL